MQWFRRVCRGISHKTLDSIFLVDVYTLTQALKYLQYAAHSGKAGVIYHCLTHYNLELFGKNAFFGHFGHFQPGLQRNYTVPLITP